MVVGVCAFVLAVLCIACRFEYAPIDQAIRLAALLALALLLSSAGWPRLALLLESFALFVATVMVMPALSSICAFLALPLQDDVLAAIDRWMGIDWTALAFWYRDHPVVTHILFDAYASVSWQPALLIFLLAFLDPERLRRLVTASAISLAATVFVFFLVPALGPYHYFNLPRAEFPDVTNLAPWYIPPLVEGLRNGSHNVVIDGLVTFPSYHAATSILFAFGWIGVPFIGAPLIVLNMVMLVSTVPIGSHYVIDVIAGMAVAFASLRLSNMYFRASDRTAPLATWERTPEGQAVLAYLGQWPIIGARVVRALNAFHEERPAAT